ncbi:ricin-type beta-trefoil lectin domain protein [Streptomyces viridiviolaceus]
MTTSKPNDSPDEPTAVASARAEGAGEAEGRPESAGRAAERILTSAQSTGRPAVPSALAEPEPEPEEPERREATEEAEEAEEAQVPEEADPESLGALAVATAAGSSTSGPEAEVEAAGSEERPATAGPDTRTSAGTGATGTGATGTGSSDTAAASSSQDTAASRTSEGASAADASAATAQASRAAADTAAASHATAGDSTRTETGTAPGRPHKSLLAGAAIVGALLISVPFLVSGGDGDDGRSSARSAATPGTVLDGVAAGAVPGVVGSESPSPHASKGKVVPKPKTVTTTGPDGKPVTVTVAPEAGASGGGKKSSGGGGPAAAEGGQGKTQPGSGSTSGKTSSGSGSTSDKSSSGSGSTSDDPTPPAPSEPWPGGVQIYSHASGRCIGVANSPNAPVGSKLVIWDCYDESYQRWTFVDGTVRSEGKCMNVSGGATNNGAVINWTTCNGSVAQKFHLNSSHDLTNAASGNKCVDVIDQRTDNGARLQLWQCYGTPNQKWSTRTP